MKIMGDKDIVMRNTVLWNGENYIDVSDYKVVIWGSGKISCDMCYQMQLDEIDMIVDTDKEAQGTEVRMYGKIYKVMAPRSVYCLTGKIIILSGDYNEPRFKSFFAGKENVICCNPNNLFGYYDSVRSLLSFDPIMVRKIADGNISGKMEVNIRTIQGIIDDYTENINKYYVPMRGGARISFVITDEQFHPMYVFHFPAKRNRELLCQSDERFIREAFELKEKFSFEKNIKIYENVYGFELGRYAEKISDWNSKKLINEVISLLRKVHCTEYEGPVTRKIADRLMDMEEYIKRENIDFPWNLSKRLHNSNFYLELQCYIPRLCHGDITCDNIMKSNGEIEFIDWEWIGKSDPMFDICRVYTSLKYLGFKMVIGKYELLNMYLGRDPDISEVRHFEVMLLCDEYMRYMSYLMTGAVRDKYTEKFIDKLIDNYLAIEDIIYISEIGESNMGKGIKDTSEFNLPDVGNWKNSLDLFEMNDVGGYVEFVNSFCHNFFNYKDKLAQAFVKEHIFTKNYETSKNIAFYYKKYGQGGVERVMSLLMPLLLEEGYKIILITETKPDSNDFVLPDGIKRFTIPAKQDIDSKKILYRERANAIISICEEEKIDTVCYQESSSRYLLFDLIVFKSINVRFILSKHELFSQHFSCNKDILKEEMSVYPLVDALTVLSKEEEYFWKVLGVNSTLIPNPLTVKMHSDNYNPHSKEIIWVGRLDRNQKKYQDIVPIMHEVVKKLPNVVLRIYGSPETYKDLYLLEKQIHEYALEDNVKYMGYSNGVDDIYKNASLILMTSAYESAPMVITESKQFGIPLVVYSMPYVEVLKDGKGYMEIPQGDFLAAAEAVVQLLSDEERLVELHNESLESIQDYSNEEVKDKWRELLNGSFYQEVTGDSISGNIIKTMAFHMSMGCAKHKELSEKYKKLMDEKKLNKLSEICNKRGLCIALYPYGALGKRLHKILTANNMSVKLIVDNGLSNRIDDIVSVKDLKDIEIDDFMFVITSDNFKVYDGVRNEIRSMVPEENIYDWYPLDEE